MSAPTGLGMWIAFHDMAAPGGNWEKVLEKCKAARVDWLAIRAGGASRENDWSPIVAKKVIAQCHAAGVKVFPWWYSMPSTVGRELLMVPSLLDDGADGIICDAEAEWNGEPIKAIAYAEALRKLLGDEAWLAHAPFDHPEYWSHWPYEEFGAVCNAVMPQFYWTEHNNKGAQFLLQVAAPMWDRLRVKHPKAVPTLMPIGVSYGTGSVLAPHAPGKFTIEDVQTFLAAYVACPAISLYSWENADKSLFPYLSQPREVLP